MRNINDPPTSNALFYDKYENNLKFRYSTLSGADGQGNLFCEVMFFDLNLLPAAGQLRARLQ